MARIAVVFLLICALLMPAATASAAFSLNVAVGRQDDGTVTGELWFNDRVVWRLRIASDGAQPVSGPAVGNTTVVAPDVEGGLFLLKVYNQ
ncbi:hypothetical protein [Anaeroselena agilis]|uniref:Uncharacterized protein n=1 Tax=Anaeroselena agilis TaxID=3063788 RepID=A0ABU3P102_9FIRM|nr:hypothetical protein [Selenomonadales bacterium 4137-cl]